MSKIEVDWDVGMIVMESTVTAVSDSFDGQDICELGIDFDSVFMDKSQVLALIARLMEIVGEMK